MPHIVTTTVAVDEQRNDARSMRDPVPSDAVMSPGKLARLDIGLLRSLNRLGTSRERICAVLCLSAAEYDYVLGLT